MLHRLAPRPLRIDLPGRGGSVAALDFGPEDRPIDIVFSHANGFNALTYRTILQPVADRRRILAYDLRGHGATDLPTETEGRQDWYDFGEDLAALLEALDLKDVVLAGHSMGGAASLMAAAACPGRVKGLALFDPVVLPQESSGDGSMRDNPMAQGALRRRNRFASREAAVEAYVGRGAMKTWTRAMVEDYVAGGLRPTADGEFELACSPQWEANNFMTQGHDVWSALARIEAPMTILRAERNSTAYVDALVARRAGDVRFRAEVVPGTTHFLPMERPDLVQAVLVSLS
jgi:pimeloyl-ACP methyl ester carboxylesterase